MKQHNKPCGTCPFAVSPKIRPGDLGGSPPEVYVAQHFLPYRVPCHELVDYDTKDWKADANTRAECVGFAMCRNSSGSALYLPDALYDQPRTPESGAFRDIWDFWAYHTECSREQALRMLTPNEILRMCVMEVDRHGMTLFDQGDKTSPAFDKLKEALIEMVRRPIAAVYLKACLEQFIPDTGEKPAACPTPPA